MTSLIVYPASALRGSAPVPGDKSISHRAVLLGAIAEGMMVVRNFLPAGDCLATLAAVQALGVRVEQPEPTTLRIHGVGLRGLGPPVDPVYCSRSGTTMRLLAGLMAGHPSLVVLTGDPQLLRRPMERVADPLRRMGAEVHTVDGHGPLTIRGGTLHGVTYPLPVASAQVKSAILLAALYAQEPTTILQPGPSRDHTERMLAAMGATLTVDDDLAVTLIPGQPLKALEVIVPGDFSSAAFLLVAATLVPGSEVTVTGVNVNPTRTGLLDILQTMGASFQVIPRPSEGDEPVADITVRPAPLQATTVGGEQVVRAIDEFPIFAVAATQADGVTTVRNAGELRVKESDRIASAVNELRKLGARIQSLPDGFVVEGPTPLKGGRVSSHGDHRLAMALTVAGLIAREPVVVEDADCIADSFPGFVETMRRIGAEIQEGKYAGD